MSTNLSASQYLCLTICAYRNPSLTEEEYYDYMTQTHAPLVKPLMEKYGIIRFTMTHNVSETRTLMKRIVDPQFANVADYDCIVQIVFRDIEDFVAMKADPEYQKFVAPDHEKFADTKRSKMTIGYIQNFFRELS